MRAAARGNPRRIVGDVDDAVERHAEPFADKLRKTRLVALPRGHRAHDQLDLSFGQHGDFAAFARGAGGDLDIIGNADPAHFAAPPGFSAADWKAVPISERQCGRPSPLGSGRCHR